MSLALPDSAAECSGLGLDAGTAAWAGRAGSITLLGWDRTTSHPGRTSGGRDCLTPSTILKLQPSRSRNSKGTKPLIYVALGLSTSPNTQRQVADTEDSSPPT